MRQRQPLKIAWALEPGWLQPGVPSTMEQGEWRHGCNLGMRDGRKWQEERQRQTEVETEMKSRERQRTGQDAAKMVVTGPSLRVSTITPGLQPSSSTPSPSWSGLGLWTGLSREDDESQMPRGSNVVGGGLGGEVGGVSKGLSQFLPLWG